MVGTPEYYAVCADVIREVCEAFGYPRFIHLGMDEEQQVKAPVLTREAYIMRGEALWWHDMNFYFSEAEKHGAQPWVWSDYYWRNSESFIKNMSRSAIQSNWFYQRFNKYPDGDLANKRIATYEELDAHGFLQVPTASQCRGYDGALENTLETLIHAQRKLTDANVLGFMMAPWGDLTDDSVYYNKDGAIRLLRAREAVYPETLK